MSISPKERRFAYEYLKDQKGGPAAIRAGYSKRSADQIASRLLRKDKVNQEIEKGLAEIRERAGVTAEKVIQALWNIAKIDIRQVFNTDGTLKDIHEMPEEIACAIASIEVDEEDPSKTKVKFWNKTEALGTLGRFLRLSVDRHEHTGPHGGPIPVNQPPLDFSGFTTAELKRFVGMANANGQ